MTYLSYNYFFALAPTLAICIKRKSFPSKKEWLIGSGLGLTGLFGMFFLVLALDTVPGTIAFPLNIMVVNISIVILSYFIWKERLSIKQIIGVCTGIIATFLISLKV